MNEEVLKENNVVIPKKLMRHLPPKNELNHKTELKEIKNQLSELPKIIDRVNRLLVAHAQDSNNCAMVMRRGLHIIGERESHILPILSKIFHLDRGVV